MSKKQWIGVGFLFPALLLLVSFMIIPFVLTIYYSFTDFYMLMPDAKEFIGFGNYSYLFSDPTFAKAAYNTAIFAIFVVPLQMGLAFLFALLINQVSDRSKLKGYYKVAFFAPTVMSLTVISLLWTILLSDAGLINQLIVMLGGERQPFLTSADQAMPVIIAISAWQGMGYQMIIFLAGLQGIPRSQYEAAELDNASAWQKFLNVTLPGIKPILILILLTITIGATKLFVQPMIMTGGGPAQSTYTMVYYIFDTANNFRQVGLASAMSVIFTIVVIILSTIQQKVTRGE